jgi:hypothetical protein
MAMQDIVLRNRLLTNAVMSRISPESHRKRGEKRALSVAETTLTRTRATNLPTEPGRQPISPPRQRVSANSRSRRRRSTSTSTRSTSCVWTAEPVAPTRSSGARATPVAPTTGYGSPRKIACFPSTWS